MEPNFRIINTEEDYFESIRLNKRIFLDGKINSNDSGAIGKLIDHKIHPYAGNVKGKDCAVRETKTKPENSFSPYEVCSGTKNTPEKKLLKEGFDKIKEGLCLITYRMGKDKAIHDTSSHPLVPQKLKKDYLDLVNAYDHTDIIEDEYYKYAKVISKDKDTNKVQIANADMRKIFKKYKIIKIA